MMTNETEKYLQRVSAGLSRLPEPDQKEILEEIRNHIYEAVNRQEPPQSVLDKLGSPLKLAQSYVNIYHLENDRFKMSTIFSHIAFYLSAGFSSMIVVPFLFLTGVIFAIVPVFLLGYSFLGLFLDLPGVINLGAMVFTGFPAFIVAIISSVILIVLALLCRRGLRKYLAFISNRYQHIRFRS